MLVRKSICCKTFQGGSWGGGGDHIYIYIYTCRAEAAKFQFCSSLHVVTQMCSLGLLPAISGSILGQYWDNGK